jgi:mannose-6-phosphate isomerase
MSQPAYPLRCQPHFRSYLWGGRQLASRLNKTIPSEGVWAESWEIIDHSEHQSVVAGGPLDGKTLRQIASQAPEWLLGPGLNNLPLLLKYLDCQNVLSIQVHPNDDYARKMVPSDLGKTEAWYIVQRQPGAVLYAGLKAGVTSTQLQQAIAAGIVQECLHQVQPEPGDCVFIPAGTVHALGAGLLVAEIQQASNTTFRLFDWNRTGPDGKPRPLHIQQALDVIDFESGPARIQTVKPTSQSGRQNLVTCDKFLLDRISEADSILLGDDNSFHFLTAPGGGVILEGEQFREELKVGQSILLPAALRHCTAKLEPNAVLLDMYLPT